MQNNKIKAPRHWGVGVLSSCALMAMAGCSGGPEASDSGASATGNTASSALVVISSVSSAPAMASESSASNSSLSLVAMDYSKLTKTALSGKGLVLADAAELERHIKNGLRLYLSSQYRRNNYCYGDYFPGIVSSVSSSSQPFLVALSNFEQLAVVASSVANSSIAHSNSSSTSSSSSSASSVIYDYCYYHALGASSSQLVFSSQAAFSSAASQAQSSNSDNFTQTNTHVKGIDEADFAKYDGQHWFVAVNGYSNTSGIDIYEANPNAATLTAVGRVELPTLSAVDDLYLVQQAGETTGLAMLQSDNQGYGYLPAGGYWGVSYPVNGHTQINVADVSDPSNAALSWSVTIDGSLINSRKVGNTLYLVTRYEPWLAGAEFDYQDLSLRAKNEERLAAASLEDLLPKITIGESQTVLAPDCYVQQGLSEGDGYRSLVYVTSVDMASQQVVSSRCVNMAVDGMSMSGESLYLTAGRYEYSVNHYQTVIHKFTTQDSHVEYAASGDVWGSLTGRSDAAFRMDEYQSDLRVVASNNNVHKLFVLEQQGSALNIAAELPNTARPEAIGKPNEDIFAVRFNGEQAQIVTFRQTDPLYTLDLSDRLDPKIAGQLEILGFADYIHPINNDYVFTLGRDADANGRITGMKVALYDVSGADPVEIQSHVYEGRNVTSSALNDLRALSVLTVDAQTTRFVVPFTKNSYSWQGGVSGFLLFEIKLGNGQVPVLNAVGAKITQDYLEGASASSQMSQSSEGFFTSLPYFYADRQRSVLHDDAVFMTENGNVWADSWQNLSAESAVKKEQSLRCEQVSEVGFFSVTVEVKDNYACNAKVTLQNQRTGEQTTLTGQADTHERCYYNTLITSADTFKVQATLGGFAPQEYTFTPSQCLTDIKSVQFMF